MNMTNRHPLRANLTQWLDSLIPEGEEDEAKFVFLDVKWQPDVDQVPEAVNGLDKFRWIAGNKLHWLIERYPDYDDPLHSFLLWSYSDKYQADWVAKIKGRVRRQIYTTEKHIDEGFALKWPIAKSGLKDQRYRKLLKRIAAAVRTWNPDADVLWQRAAFNEVLSYVLGLDHYVLPHGSREVPRAQFVYFFGPDAQRDMRLLIALAHLAERESRKVLASQPQFTSGSGSTTSLT